MRGVWKKRCFAVALSLCGAAGCGDYGNQALKEDMEFLSAIPTRTLLEIRIDDLKPREVALGEDSAGLASQEQTLLGAVATWFLIPTLIAAEINQGVFQGLDLVDLITTFPPAEREPGRRVWGPWFSQATPNTEWQFSMTHETGEPAYLFWLQVREKKSAPSQTGDDFLDCAFGEASPSHQSFRRGTGQFTVNASVCSQFEGTGEQGTASVSFDTTPDVENPEGKTELNIVFEDFISKKMLERDPNPQPLNTDYRYLERTDRSGFFNFDMWVDINEGTNPSLDKKEHVEAKLRWNNQGAGRADLRWSEGDLVPLVDDMHECWDTKFKRVYYQDTYNVSPAEGDPSDCAFEAASFP